MNSKLKELAIARANYQMAKDARNRALEAYQASPEYTELAKKFSAAAVELEDAENQVKGDALELYEADGIKKHDGYTIKVFAAVNILDKHSAFEWCLSHFTPALKLDTKVFEKAAKDGSVPATLVTVSELPKVYIDGDLSAYLE